MSPRPEEYRRADREEKDRARMFEAFPSSSIMKDLIQARLDIQQVPGEKILFDHNREHKVSRALVMRGSALQNFLEFVQDHDLLPQSQRDGVAFGFWRRHFGVVITKDDESDVLAVTRVLDGLSHPVFVWRETSTNHFLSKESQIAIATLSIVPDSQWEDIKNKGFIVGTLRGDVNDTPWRVKGAGVVYLDKGNVFGYDHKSGAYIVEDAYRWELGLWFPSVNPLTEKPAKFERRREFVASNDVFGIFADLRTMK
jgi:hypothetical protein